MICRGKQSLSSSYGVTLGFVQGWSIALTDLPDQLEWQRAFSTHAPTEMRQHSKHESDVYSFAGAWKVSIP